MVTTSHQKLGVGTHEITITASGFERYTARIRVSSTGSISCVSVSDGGSCSSSVTPGMTISGRTVSTRMKSAAERCVRDSDCESGYKCFSGICRKIAGCTTTPNFSFDVSGREVRFINTSRTTGSGCTIKEYYWDFGDSDEEFKASPTHLFRDYSRNYRVRLDVTDSAGNKRSVTKTVRTGSSSSGGAVCTPGQRKCVGSRGVQECQSNGTWSRTVYCPSGYHCTNGDCIRDSGGVTPSTDMDTETKDLSIGATHTIRVSHNNYEMLSMKIRIDDAGTVTCASVEGGACNRTTPPGAKISGSTVTVYMKEGEGGDVGSPDYDTWLARKGGLSNLITPDIMELRDNIVGLNPDLGFDAITPQYMECKEAVVLG